MMIDIVISLMLISLFLTTVLTIQFHVNKIKKYTLGLKEDIEYMRELKLILLKNFTYEEIININNQGKLYINKSDINMEILKKNDVENLLKTKKYALKPYIKIGIEEFEKNIAMKIRIELFYNYFGSQKSIKVEFIKGNYL